MVKVTKIGRHSFRTVSYGFEIYEDFVNTVDKLNHLVKTVEKLLKSKDAFDPLQNEESSINKNNDDDDSASFFSVESERSKRRKRFLRDSFDRDKIAQTVLNLIQPDAILRKLLEQINFKQIFEQIIRNIDIPSVLKNALGDIEPFQK